MPKAGPYYLYMLDFKKDQEQKLGRTLGMPEVSQMASESWNVMSDDDKTYYKEKAMGQNNVRIPRRSCGTSIASAEILLSNRSISYQNQNAAVSLYEQKAKEKKRQTEYMRLRIGNMLQRIPLMTDFLNYPLYFMYGNYFYKNDDGNYCPAEVALIKFTFRDGVLSRYHDLIQPESVELGFAYPAKAHSEETHRLPTPPNALGEKDFGRIYHKIKRFLKDGNAPVFDGGKYMVFAYNYPYENEESQINVLKDFLQQFAGESEQCIDVFPLTRLFYVLQNELAKNGICKELLNEKFAEVLMSRDSYENLTGIGCKHHEDNDATQYCAQNRVRRLTFLMADHFCEYMGLSVIPGKHIPDNIDLSGSLLSLKSETSLSDSDDQDQASPFFEGKTYRGPYRDMRSSVSTLNFDNESIITASSGLSRRRPSRSSIVAQAKDAPLTPSASYNRR